MDPPPAIPAPTPESAASQLQLRLQEKDAEIEAVRRELANLRTGEAASISLPGTPVEDGDLRKQLADATAKWRREERRAKAREEELLKSVEQETARADGLLKDLDKAREETKGAQEKIRDATRKRATAEANRLALRTELDAAQQTISEMEMTVAMTKASLADAGRERDAKAQELASLQERLAAVEHDCQAEITSARLECDRRVAAMQGEIGVLRRNVEASDERLQASKSASKQTTQLVKDLKVELIKAQKSPPTSPAATPDRLTRELADRLETLLKDNAALREKVKYLEDIVQVLTVELKGR